MSTATLPDSTSIHKSESLGSMLKSTGIVVAGAILLLPGFLGSLMILALDLYPFSIEGGPQIVSPLGEILVTPAGCWVAYAAASLMVVIGMILIGSQSFCNTAAVAYVMCPIVALAYALGGPLRGDRSWNRWAAKFYLVGGLLACIAGVIGMARSSGSEFTMTVFELNGMIQLGAAGVVGALLYSAKRAKAEVE